MEEFSILFIFLGVLLFLLMTGFPIPYAVGLTSVIVLLVDKGFSAFSFRLIAGRMLNGVNSFTMLAIPFFILTAKMMNTGGITDRIFKFANLVVGWLPGGLGHANIVASMIFAGMSGSSVADAAGLGQIEIKAMVDAGYDKDFSAGVTAASSVIGPIIPPSIGLVVFGVAGDVSIAALLLSGIIPGILLGLSMMVIVYIMAIKKNYPRTPFQDWKVLWKGFREAFPALLTPIILIGGMMSGIFTPTEAAAAAFFYAFILSVFVYKEIKIKGLINAFYEAVEETSFIMFIIASASIFGWLLVRTQIPYFIMDTVTGLDVSPLAIFFIFNIFWLIMGCFMEPIVNIIILAPIVVPVAIEIGIDPVQLGLVMVLNITFGLITPPIGTCLYVTSRVAKLSVERVIRAVLPFYFPILVTIIIVTVFPIFSLFLPNIFLGR